MGAGFVAFSTSEEASRALAEMNGKIVFGKPLYFAIAETKEERKAKFKASVPQRQTWQLPRKLTPDGSPWQFKRPDSTSVKDLEALLERKTAEVRRKVLGESLYPLVETHEPILARKITGMILEMKETEILHLIASPDT